MGSEGVRLLDMREREINEMRDHLKGMLRVMEQKSKTKVASSHILVTRPSYEDKHDPHLKPIKTEAEPHPSSKNSGGTRKSPSKKMPRRGK